jgi:hypothetical protein
MSLKLVAAVLAALVIGLLVWMGFDREAPDRTAEAAETIAAGAEPVAPAPEPEEPELATPGEAPAAAEPAPAPRTDAPGDPAAEQALRTEELAREVAALSGRSDVSPEEALALLRELVALGTPEAIGVVVDAMEDPDLVFRGKSEALAELLMQVDDPRIGPAAERMFTRALEGGAELDEQAQGYLRLMAVKGGPAGARALYELVRRDDAIGLYATRSIAELGDTSLGPEFLALAKERDGEAAQLILRGVAAWQEPALLDQIGALAHDATASLPTRRAAAVVAGEQASAERIGGLLAPYWSAQSDEDRLVTFDLVRGSARAGALGDGPARTEAERIVLDALANGSEAVRSEALLVLRDGAALRTPATEGELRALLDRLEEPAERTRVQDVLSLYGASGG